MLGSFLPPAVFLALAGARLAIGTLPQGLRGLITARDRESFVVPGMDSLPVDLAADAWSRPILLLVGLVPDTEFGSVGRELLNLTLF